MSCFSILILYFLLPLSHCVWKVRKACSSYKNTIHLVSDSELPVKLLLSYILLLHHCTSGVWGLEMDKSGRLEFLHQGSIGASHMNSDTTEKSKWERSLCSTFPSFPLPFKHLLPWDHGCLKLPVKSTKSDGHPWLGTPHIRAAPFLLLDLSSLVTHAVPALAVWIRSVCSCEANPLVLFILWGLVLRAAYVSQVDFRNLTRQHSLKLLMEHRSSSHFVCLCPISPAPAVPPLPPYDKGRRDIACCWSPSWCGKDNSNCGNDSLCLWRGKSPLLAILGGRVEVISAAEGVSYGEISGCSMLVPHCEAGRGQKFLTVFHCKIDGWFLPKGEKRCKADVTCRRAQILEDSFPSPGA